MEARAGGGREGNRAKGVRSPKADELTEAAKKASVGCAMRFHAVGSLDTLDSPRTMATLTACPGAPTSPCHSSPSKVR